MKQKTKNKIKKGGEFREFLLNYNQVQSQSHALSLTNISLHRQKNKDNLVILSHRQRQTSEEKRNRWWLIVLTERDASHLGENVCVCAHCCCPTSYRSFRFFVVVVVGQSLTRKM